MAVASRYGIVGTIALAVRSVRVEFPAKEAMVSLNVSCSPIHLQYVAHNDVRPWRPKSTATKLPTRT